MRPHKPESRRGIVWPVCADCGLVFLRNDATQTAIRLGCNYKSSPAIVAEQVERATRAAAARKRAIDRGGAR